MKSLLITILSLFCLFSCNNEDAPACLKSTGDIKEYIIELDEFSSIDVHNNIHVIIEQGTTRSVTLTTGENMFNEVTFEVIDGELIIKDLNRCDWARPFDNLNVHIVTPTLSQIRSSGGGTISSKGVLRFANKLVLIAEEYTADFILEVDLTDLHIVNNDVANYYISGQVKQLKVVLAAGDGRFEGESLQVENADLFQRGTNDIVINASHSIKGEIHSTGNIIYCAVPASLDVQIFDDRGKLINSCN
jgi:hypothetical protein